MSGTAVLNKAMSKVNEGFAAPVQGLTALFAKLPAATQEEAQGHLVDMLQLVCKEQAGLIEARDTLQNSLHDVQAELEGLRTLIKLKDEQLRNAFRHRFGQRSEQAAYIYGDYVQETIENYFSPAELAAASQRTAQGKEYTYIRIRKPKPTLEERLAGMDHQIVIEGGDLVPVKVVDGKLHILTGLDHVDTEVHTRERGAFAVDHMSPVYKEWDGSASMLSQGNQVATASVPQGTPVSDVSTVVQQNLELLSEDERQRLAMLKGPEAGVVAPIWQGAPCCHFSGISGEQSRRPAEPVIWGTAVVASHMPGEVELPGSIFQPPVYSIGYRPAAESPAFKTVGGNRNRSYYSRLFSRLRVDRLEWLDEKTFRIASPPPLIKGSVVSPSLAAKVMTMKYEDSIPLYRQEHIWRRQGLKVTRATLANWVIRISDRYLRRLYKRLIVYLLKTHVIHADESWWQVHREPDKANTSESRAWVYCTGRHEKYQLVVFEYKPDRNGDNAVNMLTGFGGCAITDGFSGYHKLIAQLENVVLCGCWSHARRAFREAMPDGATPETSAAAKGADYIDKLFKLERKWKNLSPSQRLDMRQKEAAPLVEEFYNWLDKLKVGKSKLQEAVTYAQNQKKYLLQFLSHGDVDISNNAAERAVKVFVIGRKNWLFSDSPRGAEATAILYSLIGTVKKNGLDPFYYLQTVLDLMRRLGDDITDEELDAMLPWSPMMQETIPHIQVPEPDIA